MVGVLVAGPFLDHRPLTLAEQAAIAGGEKGKTCGTPGIGTACNDADNTCSGSCEGKNEGEVCGTWKQYEKPDRCVNTQDETKCCADDGSQTQEKVLCVTYFQCKCFEYDSKLICSDRIDTKDDETFVFKCVSGDCPDD